MITQLKLIPVVNGEHPFAAAAEKCGFTSIGYVEDEYFMTGTANIYGETQIRHLSFKYLMHLTRHGF